MLILRNRDMLRLWLGQVLSQAGTRMQQIALAWWIVTCAAKELSGGAGAAEEWPGGAGARLGIFMVAGALPPILLVKAAGRKVDSTPSKKVLVGADLLSAAVAAAMGATLAASRLSFPWACVGIFVLAGLQSFFDPALNKTVSEVVEPVDMEEAVAFQSSTQSLASFAGAVAGALLIDRLGLAGVTFLNAASYLLSGLINAGLRMRYAQPAGAHQDSAGLSAWAILDRMPLVKRVLIGFGLVNFFMTPILLVLPLYVKVVLAGSATLLGTLEAGLWVGLVAGTAVSKWRGFASCGGDEGSAGILRLGAKCLGVIGACILLPGVFSHRWLFMALLFFAGAALGVNNVKFVALFQARVAPEHKGRFFALMAALVSFTFPAAFFLFGLLTDFLDPRLVCVIQGLGILGLAAYFSRLAAASRSFECAGSPEGGKPAAIVT
ncbi:MAG: MFS transporter [Elusimicrobia bacterium]|nr:MFS transporter [Elusimicrobiota bacterium]